MALALLALGLAPLGCQTAPPLAPADAEVAESLGLDPDRIAELADRPLYTFERRDVDAYLRYLHATMPDLRDRVAHLARKNLGQPYEIYLLGEAPFELHDAQPILSIDRSDCVVFAEHTYAMALSHDWTSFVTMLQRIRYERGRIGLLTRNHYTEADWNPHNAWLVEDLIDTLPDELTASYPLKVDRAAFFKKRYGLDTGHLVETLEVGYVPADHAVEAAADLQNGDLINFVRGKADPETGEVGRWVGHVGLIVRGDDGAVHVIHSAKPRVREEPLADIVADVIASRDQRDAEGKSRTYGYKFLRLVDDPMANLVAIDGPLAPRVTLPISPPTAAATR